MPAGHRRWRTIAATVRNENRPCWLHEHGLCIHNGQPIRYDLAWPHTLSYSADHITPTNHGGHDTYTNCAATHLGCNTARHDRILTMNARSDKW